MKRKTKPDGIIHWLDWSQPVLPSAAQWLWDRYSDGAHWDLSGVVIVTLGMRARNRLLELLVERAEQERAVLVPPLRMSPRGLAEYLYRPQHPPAVGLTQWIAWARALRAIPRSDLRTLTESLPPSGLLGPWLAMARMIQQLHAELGGESLVFSDVVSTLVKQDAASSEIERWERLDRIQGLYLQELKNQGLDDPQIARIRAVRENQCRANHDIVLVGAVDLNRNLREMLMQVSSHVRALVISGPDFREGFDKMGCLHNPFWADVPIAIDGDALRVADRPADQAAAAVDALIDLGSGLSPQEIVIGAPDRGLIAHLRRGLESVGLESHDAAGKPLEATAPFRLVAAVVAYLRNTEFSHFSQLVRHPDFFDAISERVGHADWLNDLDRFQMRFLRGQFHLDEGFRGADSTRLQSVHTAVRELLEPLTVPERPLAEWSEPWREFLRQVYSDRRVEGDVGDDSFAVLDTLWQAMHTLHDLPTEWRENGTAFDCIDMVLAQLVGDSIAEPVSPNAVALLGWLDLPLDDSALTVVTGFNEGIVPTSEGTNLFLPNSLRGELQIADNAQRFARDAYILSVLAHSPRRLRLIYGRHDVSGNPLLPSRLIFATDDRRAAGRARDYFQHKGSVRSRIWLPAPDKFPATQQFPIPRPDVRDLQLTSLRVTDFKVYLQCRYRFFLSRILELEVFGEEWAELPAYAFGDLVHRVVESFGRHPILDSAVAGEIRDFFRGRLSEEFEPFGGDVAPAVKIQRQQIERRLDRFAVEQAQRRRLGWKIVAVEMDDCRATIPVDGQPFEIRGRIDRIDQNEHTGQIAVFDYKTTRSAPEPDKAHRSKDGWVDLQLPLYRHLIDQSAFRSSQPIVLGYIRLPDALDKIGFCEAPWSDQDLREADVKAHEVIRFVRANAFWPPIETPPEYSEDWSAICQDEVAERFPVDAN